MGIEGVAIFKMAARHMLILLQLYRLSRKQMATCRGRIRKFLRRQQLEALFMTMILLNIATNHRYLINKTQWVKKRSEEWWGRKIKVMTMNNSD